MRDRMTNGHPRDFLIVYIGRLGAEKRLKDLRAVLDRMPADTRLCFVGTGPQQDELKAIFADASDRCVFTGQLTGDALSQAFASADVFCMPSDSETLGFVVLEAMASGVPVVGVKAGGVQDLIEDGVTGYLVEPGDTDAFVDRLLRFRQDRDLRAQMSAQGWREMEKWSWHASMAKLRNEQYVEAQANFHRRFEQRLWRLLTLRWSSPSPLKGVVSSTTE
jgi:sulfoquinovosyltransferase